MASSSHLITTKSHLPPLEGMRGILALCVVSLHFSKLFFNADWTPFGYLGVDFFFALSGFIIARQYEASIALHTTNFKIFVIRRMARLYPLYIFSIGLAIWVNSIQIDAGLPVDHLDFGMGPHFLTWLAVQATMLGSLTTMVQPNGPVWSVSAEWVVNLIFFALLWYYRRIPNMLLWIVVALGSCYSIALSPHKLDVPMIQVAMLRAVVGFCAGWLVFRYHQYFPKLPLVVLYAFEIILLGATIILALNHTEMSIYSVDYIFQLVLIPALISVCLYRYSLIGFICSLPIATFLGRISYSIYLLHYPLAFYVAGTPWFNETFGYPWLSPNLGLAYLSTLLVASILAYLVIEKPGRWLGRKLTASRVLTPAYK